MTQAAQKVTPELVSAAYAALGSGDRDQILKYWSKDLHWLVPGLHALAGWYIGLDAFLDFMKKTAELSDNSFNMEPITVLTNDEYSADVTHNRGRRAGADPESTSPYDFLDISVIHLLHWRDGKVIEGRGAIFGDGTTRFNEFWSQLRPDGHRIPQ
jgi:ketosteroid isomerase-like protein